MTQSTERPLHTQIVCIYIVDKCRHLPGLAYVYKERHQHRQSFENIVNGMNDLTGLSHLAIQSRINKAESNQEIV